MSNWAVNVLRNRIAGFVTPKKASNRKLRPATATLSGEISIGGSLSGAGPKPANRLTISSGNNGVTFRYLRPLVSVTTVAGVQIGNDTNRQSGMLRIWNNVMSPGPEK